MRTGGRNSGSGGAASSNKSWKKHSYRAAYLELTNVCNRNCAFCPGTTRAPAFMDIGLFRRLAPQVAELADMAYLHVMGEALLHPYFPEIAGIAADAGLALGLTTNGTLFDTPNAESLLAPPFRQLNISLHSDLSESGMNSVFAFTRRAFSLHPALYINYRFWNRGEDDESLMKYLRRISDEFGVDVCRIPAPGEGFPKITNRLYLNFASLFDWPDLSAPLVPEPAFCHGSVNQFAVLADGTVTPCCLDNNGSIKLGDANTHSLKDILRARRAAMMRCGFHEGRAEEELCRHCAYRTRFSGRNSAESV